MSDYNHWEYSRDQVQTMRERLAESEWEGLRDKDLREILWSGCMGWENINENEILRMYDETYGLEDLND